ncbi:unnamed protein product [Adineta steineri]|uniref:Cytochrome P450 n=1 Tax=Adineta steineri TaxID=433720 RepID=A0A813VUD8_9BILA|nr:unnamed protein product [Adineta steineri]CAF3731417.1 unnamed protein product [Adineta steineri]
MSIISILLIFFILFLSIYIIYNRFCYFSKRSIPCPPVRSILFGHLSDLWSAKSYSEQLHQWTQQYGSVYGIFEGTRPVYVISDINFIEEIFIKQFARFHSRRVTLTNRVLGEKNFNVLTAYISQLWKKQRKILNPTFSGAKMRRLLPTINTCVNIFMERLTTQTTDGTIFNIYEIYKRLTMDVICRCAFGIDTNVQYDDYNENIYMKKVEELFAKDSERAFLAKIHRITAHTLLTNICPIIFRLKRYFRTKNSPIQANLWLMEHMHEFIQQRSIDEDHQKKSIDDLLQLMIDAVHSNKDQLLPTELLSNVFIILAAGYETTSTALGYCTYRLALHQDIQEKVYEELREHWSANDNSYDTIMSKLTYMDLFVKEVLRMHPIAIQVVNRQCNEDTHVAGYDIQKDTLIQVDVLSVHYDQDLWGPEPVDEFCPERHSDKRHPLAFMPFGAGPRICIGMRFALMEIKLCLAQLISAYHILPSSSEGYKINTEEQIVIAPEKVFVKLEKRI